MHLDDRSLYIRIHQSKELKQFLTASKWKTYVKGWHNPKRKEIVNLYKSGMPFDEIVKEMDMPRNDVSWLLWIDKNMPLVLMKNDLIESDITEESK